MTFRVQKKLKYIQLAQKTCCQILYLLTFFKVVPQKQKRWVNDYEASNLRP